MLHAVTPRRKSLLAVGVETHSGALDVTRTARQPATFLAG